MIAGILFTIAALLPTILLIIVYSSQKKQKIVRTHSFKMIMYLNLGLVVFELINAYLMSIGLDDIALIILRFQWGMGTTSFFYTGFYNYLKFTNQENKTFKEIYSTKPLVKYMSLFVIALVITILLIPITNHVPGVVNYLHFPHAYIVSGYATFVLIVSVISMIKAKAYGKDNIRLCLFQGLIAGAYAICQMLMKDVACSPIFNSAIILVIYLTVENPDIYISRELEYQENIAKKISNDNNFLMSSLKKEFNYKINRLNLLLKEYKALPAEEKKEKLLKIRYELKALNGEVCNSTALILNTEADNVEVEIGLNKYLERFYNLTNNLINNTNISYRLDVLESTPAKVLINTDDLFFTMLSMFKNALNNTELGEIIFTVGSELVDGKHYLTLKCNDTGRGFTKEELEELQKTLSEHLTTEKYDKNIIALSKRREIYGGKLTVDSFEGAGSIVNVSIEYGFIDESKIPRKIIENLPIAKDDIKDYAGQKALILGTDSFLGKELLSLYNINVDSTTNAKEALDLIKMGNKYEWIFINLANKEADDAARALRSLSKQYGFYIPYVVACIPFKTKKYRQIINNNVIFNDYIIEPLEFIDLNTILEKVRRD